MRPVLLVQWKDSINLCSCVDFTQVLKSHGVGQFSGGLRLMTCFGKTCKALTLLLILLTLAFIYPKSNYKRYHLGWGQFRGERHLYC